MKEKNLIILEGVSGSGKSTLLRSLNVARDFADYHWHRFTATEWVYGITENRHVSVPDLRHYERQICRIWPTLLVTLTCDPYIALRRKENFPGEIIEPNIAEANKLFLVYHNYITVIPKKIIVNTSSRSIEECTEIILGMI